MPETARPSIHAVRQASPQPATQRLLLISPIRNEEAHFERVADAVARQTRPPDLWIVVDDDSTDRTPEILAAVEMRIPFLRVIKADREAPWAP